MGVAGVGCTCTASFSGSQCTFRVVDGEDGGNNANIGGDGALSANGLSGATSESGLASWTWFGADPFFVLMAALVLSHPPPLPSLHLSRSLVYPAFCLVSRGSAGDGCADRWRDCWPHLLWDTGADAGPRHSAEAQELPRGVPQPAAVLLNRLFRLWPLGADDDDDVGVGWV